MTHLLTGARMRPRKLIPPVYLLFALIASFAAHELIPIARLIPAPLTYAGAALILAGLLMTSSGVIAFRKARTPIVPFERSTQLVTDGLYRFTRNPMYVGLTLILGGVGLLLGTLGALLPLPVFLALITQHFIRGEEKFLEGIFGEEYLSYKRRVRRWL